LIALCAFWSCDSGRDDDDGSPSSALGDKEIMLASGEQVYNEDSTFYTFTPSFPGEKKTVGPKSGDVGPGNAAAVAALSSIDEYGKLTLKLPVFDLVAFNETWAGFTIDPPDVKYILLEKFEVAGGSALLKRNSTGCEVNYMYADKDARIYGNEEGTPPMSVDLILKQGWNSVIVDRSGSTWTYKPGIPGDGYRWVVDD
jgi:hypothetical protein